MKLLHDYTDEELMKATVIEVQGYRLVDNYRTLLYTDNEEKYCHYSDGKFYVSRSYQLTESTSKHLDGKKFSYMYEKPDVSASALIPLLNKFLTWESVKWAVNGQSVNCFSISFDTHIQRHYKMNTGQESSFERAAMIALLLSVRNTDMRNQTERPY